MRILSLSFVLLLSLAFALGENKDLNPQHTVYTDLKTALNDSDKVYQLVLKGANLKEFPFEIVRLKNLEYLDLSRNKIDSIPANINLLKNLKVLKLDKNKLGAVPVELYQLSQLRKLELGYNDISYLSPEIKNLNELLTLDIWSTNISVFPYEMTEMKSLKVIDVRGVSLNMIQQKEIMDMLPNIKILFSPPCNCNN